MCVNILVLEDINYIQTTAINEYFEKKSITQKLKGLHGTHNVIWQTRGDSCFARLTCGSYIRILKTENSLIEESHQLRSMNLQGILFCRIQKFDKTDRNFDFYFVLWLP